MAFSRRRGPTMRMPFPTDAFGYRASGPEESVGLMARKLKTYQTSLGFFDLAIAAPSMKAALQAWGSKTNLFHQGFAKETDDPAIVAATFAKPGVVLRRPVGSDGAFSEHAELPKELPIDKVKERTAKPRATTKNRRLRRSTTKQHVRPPLRSRDNGSGAIPSAGRKRPRGRRNASGASRPSQRPKPRLKNPSVTMKPRSKKSRETAPHSTDGRKRRTPRWEKQKEKLETALRRACD